MVWCYGMVDDDGWRSEEEKEKDQLWSRARGAFEISAFWACSKEGVNRRGKVREQAAFLFSPPDIHHY